MGSDAARVTALKGWHERNGARIVEFGGWMMPLHYRSIVEEHHAVRQRAGLFDISHMGRLTFHGPGIREWLEGITTNQVSRLAPDQIQYSLLVTEAGGVIDDILVYGSPFGFNVVCNAGNREAVVAHLEQHRPESAREAAFHDRTPDTAMIALQGPLAAEILQPLCPGVSLGSIRYYHSALGQVSGAEGVISRTGYTGEDGFELIVSNQTAEGVWQAIVDRGTPLGLLPCGLGARDTLRFEAAMPLYGHELGLDVNPYEAGLGWAVKLAKGRFIGQQALATIQPHPARARVGLALEGKRIARQGYTVRHEGRDVGLVTSGTFAPTLDRSLAMALVATELAAPGTVLAVDVRGQEERATVVPLPFYRRDRHLTHRLVTGT